MNTNIFFKSSITDILRFLTVILIIYIGGLQAANIPYFNINTSGPEFDRFVSFVDRAVAGNQDYGYSPTDAIILYSITGNTSYADLAIAGVDDQVSQAESLIALDDRPEVSYDSYLHVGELIGSLALTYDWAYNRLSPSQRARWIAYADQAVYNVWNPDSAKWGGASFPWSGWSIDNPGNNYYYSFLKATMYWAVATQNQTLLTFLKNVKLPPLVAYFQDLTGGGSLEGTGYGTSHKGLFELYGFWKSATSEDLAGMSSHCRGSIEYWMHATVPTLDYFAPIGDQARVSDAPIYDYQRALVVRAVLQNLGTKTARHGMWWLNHISIQQMSSSFNLKDNIFTLPDPEEKPVELSYFAPKLGDLFARTSWDTNAVWMHFKAGLFTESHAHEDQGSFSIYHDGWQAVTENIHTHSGIEQGTEVHNVIRFMKNNTEIIPQSRNDTRTCSLSYQDNGRILTIQADMANMYQRETALNGWNRSLTFDRSQNIIDIHDSFSMNQSVVSAVWQLNTPAKPVMEGDSIIAGGIVITPLDSPVQVSLLEWRSVDSIEYRSGWKIELTRPDGAMEFNVRIRINAQSTWVKNEHPDAGRIKTISQMCFNAEPNPFNQSTTVHYSGLSGKETCLAIYNLEGKMVRKFKITGKTNGSIIWNGIDIQGNPMASGVYIARLLNGSHSLETRIMLFR